MLTRISGAGFGFFAAASSSASAISRYRAVAVCISSGLRLSRCICSSTLRISDVFMIGFVSVVVYGGLTIQS
jgi:hypothetical protein